MKSNITMRNGILGGVSAILALMFEDYILERDLLFALRVLFFYIILSGILKSLDKRAEK